MKHVFVGMSGGVDSSVAAALLKQQGYAVTGVYMKNWSQDLPGMPCPWRQDYQDAKRVAVQLGIPFKLYDFEHEYKQRVVDYMVREYKAGNTPNPDVMCNQEVKFKLFVDAAVADGADAVATGHYARVTDGRLYMAEDKNKDQTYFLYRVTSEALHKTMFPLGDLTKDQVRKLAADMGLVTASKKESMGICFVGKVGIKEFLSQYVSAEPGDIVDQHNKVVGKHDGAIFYTIGQRHGLQVGGGLPFYVTSKSMTDNIVYVTTDLTDKALWTNTLTLRQTHWITGAPKSTTSLMVRARHRAELVAVSDIVVGEEYTVLTLSDEIRAVTPGQSAVLYQSDECLGGGVVSN